MFLTRYPGGWKLRFVSYSPAFSSIVVRSSMKFIVPGFDPLLVDLLEAIAADAQHDLAVGPAVDPELLPAAVTAAQFVAEREDTPVPSTGDVVIAAGMDAGVHNTVRRLAAAGHSVVVLPDVRMRTAFVHELTLIRDNVAIHLVPLFPLRTHGCVRDLLNRLHGGELGRILSARLERNVPADRTGEPTPFLPTSAPEIRQWLMWDTDLLRLIGGNYDQVTLLQSPTDEAIVRSVLVNLAGRERPDAAWVLTASTSDTWKLMVNAENGRATLSGRGLYDDLRLEITLSNSAVSECTDDSWRPGPGMLQAILTSLAEQSDLSAWSDLLRACEVVEAADRSKHRRRTVDLLFETASERTLFKTQMSAVGCAVLTWTLLGMVAWLMMAQILQPSQWVLHAARAVWLLPLVVFLAAQFLIVLARPSTLTSSRESIEKPSGDDGGRVNTSPAANDR